jgi:hypothetical protein
MLPVAPTSPPGPPAAPPSNPASAPPRHVACSRPGSSSGGDGGESQKEAADRAALSALLSGAPPRSLLPGVRGARNPAASLAGWPACPPRAACCLPAVRQQLRSRRWHPPQPSQPTHPPTHPHHNPPVLPCCPAGDVSFAPAPVGVLVLAGGRVVQFSLPEEEGAGGLASSPFTGGLRLGLLALTDSRTVRQRCASPEVAPSPWLHRRLGLLVARAVLWQEARCPASRSC